MNIVKRLAYFGLLVLQCEVLCSKVRQFPKGFQFGTSTSAFQAEGAWNVSDKSPSTWDIATQRPGKIVDNTTAEVTADSYHHFRRDVEMLRELGMDYYRFSVSWPRLMPGGFNNHISEDGKRFYTELIDELIRYNITPFITMHHFDLPQSLQDLGGWTNPEMEYWFEDYARVLFDLFADKVKWWLTINEPVVACGFSYGGSGFGSPHPFLSPGIGDYICTRHIMLAHARVWHLFDREYRHKHGGYVGYSNLMVWFEPGSKSPEDVKTTELANQFFTGLYSHQIFTDEGGWPSEVEKAVAENSKEEGYSRSRLPDWTQEEIDLMKGASDFYAFQHYYTYKVRHTETPQPKMPFLEEMRADIFFDPSWQSTNGSFIKLYPLGMRKMLNFVKDRYNDPRILITEGGFPTLTGLVDDNRINPLKDFLNQVLDAIVADGVNVTHYGFWCLMDSFEFDAGYSGRMGLYEVDFSDANRTRTARKSALVYKRIATTKSLDPDYEPDSLHISID